MGRIPGYYEWDDDELTPGQKKEGGLHQNLFDASGTLKGSARFVPAEGDYPEPVDVTEHVYVPAEERRLSPAEQELADFIGEVLVAFIGKGVERATPHVKKWWAGSVRPFLIAQRTRLSRVHPKDAQEPDPDPHEPSHSPEHTDQTPTGSAVALRGPKMSSAEAQARYLAAMAARAYSQEQMSMVQNADIVDADGIPEIAGKIAELPPSEVRELMSRMVTDPSMLTEETLAELASVIWRMKSPTRRELDGPFKNHD